MYIDYSKEKLLIFTCKVQKSVFYKENSIRQYVCYFHMKKNIMWRQWMAHNAKVDWDFWQLESACGCSHITRKANFTSNKIKDIKY
jgi:hypothetical protein